MANKKEPQKYSDGGVNINASGDVVIHGDVVGRDLVYQVNDPAKRRNQLALLSKVKEYWIKGVYEKSIHSDILLALNKEFVPDQVEHRNPWDMILETPELGKQPIPSDRQLLDVFDELHQAMLILGAPGSGKTFTLLELAKNLIIRAEKKPVEPLPVILNLSSWAERRLPIEGWVVEELFFKYQVPRRISKEWVEQDFLCLLLDGLDEVAVAHQEACVNALNLFRSNFGLMPIALCSRLEEYEALRVQLRLNGALQVLPLSPEQIDKYLSETEVEELRKDIKTDPELLKVIESPLMLNIASVAYQELSSEVRQTMPTLTADKRRDALLRSYVSTMFKRNARTNRQLYKTEEVISKLSYIAKQMIARGQSAFLVEELQPIWLSLNSRWLYLFLSRALIGLFLLMAFTGFPTIYVILFHNFGDLILTVLPAPFVILITLWFTVMSGIRFSKNSSYDQLSTLMKRPMARWLILGANFLLLGCPILVIVFMVIYTDGSIRGFDASIATAILFVVPTLLVIFLVFGFRGIGENPSNDIPILDGLYFSWKQGAIGFSIATILSTPLVFLIFIILGVSAYYSAASTGSVNTNQIQYLLLLKLGTICLSSVSVPVGLFFGILRGLRGTRISLRVGVNQGLHRSLRSSIWSTIIFGCYGLLSILIVIWIFGFAKPENDFSEIFYTKEFVSIWALLITATSVIGFLLYGGVTVINHYTLRIMLALKNHLPWRIAPFLDYCVDRVFMRRIGGGYIFIHRYLMEYFASLDNKS